MRFDSQAPETHFVRVRWAQNKFWQASAQLFGSGSPYKGFLPSAGDVIVADSTGNMIESEKLTW